MSLLELFCDVDTFCHTLLPHWSVRCGPTASALGSGPGS